MNKLIKDVSIKANPDAMFKKSAKAISALNALGIMASKAGKRLRMFANAYEDLRREIGRLYYIRLP